MNEGLFSRFSQYQYMWILVLFDLPTETRKDRKNANAFRQQLIKDGFEMFQFSIYIRSCPSKENTAVHINRVKKNLPIYGKVAIIQITDKQFAMMQLFFNTKKVTEPEAYKQLELFEDLEL